MADRIVVLNPEVIVNDVDLSGQFRSISLPSEAEVLDATGFSSTGQRQKALGLSDATITGQLFQSFDAGSVDATLEPLHSNKTRFPVIVRPQEGDNEYYAAEMILPTYDPFGGAEVGQLAQLDVTFENAGQAGIVKRERTS